MKGFQDSPSLKYVILPVDKPATETAAPNLKKQFDLNFHKFKSTGICFTFVPPAYAKLCFPILRSDCAIPEAAILKSAVEVMEQNLFHNFPFLLVSKNEQFARDFLNEKKCASGTNLLHLWCDSDNDDGSSAGSGSDDSSSDGSSSDDSSSDGSKNQEKLAKRSAVASTKGIKRKATKQKIISENLLVSSQRSDSATFRSFIAVELKFYIQLFQDNEDFVKCGISQMGDNKLQLCYQRDRKPFYAIIVDLPFMGAGIKELYDSLLKHMLAPYLLSVEGGEKKAKYTSIVKGALEHAHSTDCFRVLEPPNFNRDNHELYNKADLREIQNVMEHIYKLDMADLIKRKLQIEETKNIRPVRSRFVQKKIKINQWWDSNEIKDIYKNGNEIIYSDDIEIKYFFSTSKRMWICQH